MKSNPYDIVLIPESLLAAKAIKLSQALNSKDPYFVLDGKTFFPHLSLYMLKLSEEGLDKACDIISKIASSTNPIIGTVHHYNYESDYVDVEYVRSAEFISMQDEILSELNSIRGRMQEKYRYTNVGALFAPHMTFTRFKNDQHSVMEMFPPIEVFNGRFNSLGIYGMGDHGTCVREVKTWKLQQ